MAKLKTARVGLIGVTTSLLKPPPKEVNAHYQSPEHKAWRLAVMRRAGWKCQHPGCGRGSPQHRLFADHIIELKDGGAPLDPANGQALCGEHHTSKTVQARAARR